MIKTWAVHAVAQGKTLVRKTQAALAVTAVRRGKHRKGTYKSLLMTAMWSESCPTS